MRQKYQHCEVKTVIRLIEKSVIHNKHTQENKIWNTGLILVVRQYKTKWHRRRVTQRLITVSGEVIRHKLGNRTQMNHLEQGR